MQPINLSKHNLNSPKKYPIDGIKENDDFILLDFIPKKEDESTIMIFARRYRASGELRKIRYKLGEIPLSRLPNVLLSPAQTLKANAGQSQKYFSHLFDGMIEKHHAIISADKSEVEFTLTFKHKTEMSATIPLEEVVVTS